MTIYVYVYSNTTVTIAPVIRHLSCIANRH